MVKPGGSVSAIVCFCHSGNLPTYHGRYLDEDNHRLDYLSVKLNRVLRISVRSKILGFDHKILSADVFPEFRRAGLVDVQLNGHLAAVSPSDSRLDSDEAVRYSLARSRSDLKKLIETRDNHGEQLESDGFPQHEFAELIALKRQHHADLEANPYRVLEMGQVFNFPLLIMRGTHPFADR